MNEKLKIYSLSYGGNSWMAEDLRPIIEKLGMALFTIHEHDNADIKWELDTWLSHLRKADIVIAPANYRVQPAKSANRLVQAMSLGKPVVCSPLPAYLDVAEKYPSSFLLADSPEEWEECFNLLKEAPFRKQIGKRALEAAQGYSIDAIGNKWLKLLKESVPSPRVEYDLTDIVIPTYKNLRGLKLCIESIIECTTVPYKIIVVNNGDDEELHKFCDQRNDIVYIKENRLNFAQAINTGIKAGESKYVMLLNDDVIVSRGWLKSLIDECTEEVGAVGPLSSCDKNWRHFYDINIGGVELLPGSNTFEQIEPIIPQIYEYKSPYPEIKKQEWVAFYCTLIPRSVINEVGLLDESFTNSGEDVDYCHRISKQGYNIIQNFKSFVFHFGAVSRKILESEDKGSYQEADRQTQAYLREKYAKPTIIIYSGPSWELWSYKSLEEGGIGGSEVWQIQLCREFDKLGYRVISFNDSSEEKLCEGNIQYLHLNQFPQWCEHNYADYAILSRTTDPLKYPLRVGKVFVMIHDIYLLSPKDQLFLDKVDKFCVLSKWHWDFAKDYHNIPDESKLALTSNGIDFSRYDNKDIKRDPYRLFYSSSADRGLDTLLYLFPFIKEKIPELELHVYYGFDNWEKAAKIRNNPAEIERMNKIKEDLKQPGVFNHGRIGQKELAEEQLKCSLWAYPTAFEEVFCCFPGTKINTKLGYRNIEVIKEEEKVLSHKGSYRKVKKVFKREVKEKLIEIEVTSLKDHLKITQNHPVLILRRQENLCLRKKGSNEYPTICTKRKAFCKRTKVCENFNKPYEPIWLKSGDLKESDFVLYPINRHKDIPSVLSDYMDYKVSEGSIIKERESIYESNSKEVKRTVKTKLIDFKITPHFLEVCGWYVAEGCGNRGNIRFILSIKEIKEAEFIKSFFDSIGVHCKLDVIKKENSQVVTVSSAILSEFMCQNFGKKAKVMRIPIWVKRLDPDILKYFLRGLLHGDGCFHKDRNQVTISSASNELIYDLFDLLLKFRCVSFMGNCQNSSIINIRDKESHIIINTKDKKLPIYRLECSISQNIDFFKFCDYPVKKSNNNYRYLIDENYVYLSISSYKIIDYEGPVYNLEVETDNSYIANNVIVHNCITAIEAQRARIPVLSSNYAGLQTTIGDSGNLIGTGIKNESLTRDYRIKFVDECIKMLKDQEYREYWIEKGFENSKKYSWEQVAKNWVKLFEEDNKEKIEVIPEVADPIDPEKYKDERISAHKMDVGESYMPNPHKHLNNERDRLHYSKVLGIFGQSNSYSALDVGCFDGWIDFLLIEQGFRVTGVELMEPLVLSAQRYAQSNNVDYKIYKGFFEEIEIDEKFDLVICLETLEHISFDLVPVYIKKMEELASKGLFISLPDQSHEENHQHLWTPTEKLIKRMWGDRKNFSLEYHTYKNNSIPANWFVYFEV